ncbi:MAG: hypothetical protein LJE62_07925 [Silicimonas sp.]|nr:hypothetical protein [Silicimonas sp.]
MKKTYFEVRHPIFRPFWTRALFTGVISGWALFEWTNNSQVWAMVFGAAGLYLFLQFFVFFDPAEYEKKD